ncbi:AAA family ATPase [Shewanella kaireitica]|uniref:AAA family ATPase n=1 Tax=Shewanella kaireitica TaxID=212021 RepID=UPI00200FC11C|nr:AAA family ATPase [Shewanella kaireitica]MCL1094372.1 ATP-binding protein [Shewanella kaireitica]
MLDASAEQKLAIIMRGLPGSGKSHWAKEFVTTYQQSSSSIQAEKQYGIFSTDSFFYNMGVYQFNPKLLPKFHQLNLAAFIEAMAGGLPLVICDNTNIAYWEFKAYSAAAMALGYEVRIQQIGDPASVKHQQLCAKRNCHGVPFQSIKRMASMFEVI